MAKEQGLKSDFKVSSMSVLVWEPSAVALCIGSWLGGKQALALNSVSCAKPHFLCVRVCLGMSAGLWRFINNRLYSFKEVFSVPGLDEGVAHLPLQPPISNRLNQISPTPLYNITTKNCHEIPPQ